MNVNLTLLADEEEQTCMSFMYDVEVKQEYNFCSTTKIKGESNHGCTSRGT